MCIIVLKNQVSKLLVIKSLTIAQKIPGGEMLIYDVEVSMTFVDCGWIIGYVVPRQKTFVEEENKMNAFEKWLKKSDVQQILVVLFSSQRWNTMFSEIMTKPANRTKTVVL